MNLLLYNTDIMFTYSCMINIFIHTQFNETYNQGHIIRFLYHSFYRRVVELGHSTYSFSNLASWQCHHTPAVKALVYDICTDDITYVATVHCRKPPYYHVKLNFVDITYSSNLGLVVIIITNIISN